MGTCFFLETFESGWLTSETSLAKHALPHYPESFQTTRQLLNSDSYLPRLTRVLLRWDGDLGDAGGEGTSRLGLRCDPYANKNSRHWMPWKPELLYLTSNCLALEGATIRKTFWTRQFTTSLRRLHRLPSTSDAGAPGGLKTHFQQLTASTPYHATQSVPSTDWVISSNYQRQLILYRTSGTLLEMYTEQTVHDIRNTLSDCTILTAQEISSSSQIWDTTPLTCTRRTALPTHIMRSARYVNDTHRFRRIDPKHLAWSIKKPREHINETTNFKVSCAIFSKVIYMQMICKLIVASVTYSPNPGNTFSGSQLESSFMSNLSVPHWTIIIQPLLSYKQETRVRTCNYSLPHTRMRHTAKYFIPNSSKLKYFSQARPFSFFNLPSFLANRVQMTSVSWPLHSQRGLVCWASQLHHWSFEVLEPSNISQQRRHEE